MHLRLLLFLLFGLGYFSGAGQSLDFQRNNNKPEHWWLIESDHFNLYFQDTSTDLAKSILPASIAKLSSIEEKIGYRLSGRINIYFHRSIAQLNSTYANQKEEEEKSSGGITEIIDNDVHVYLTGSQVDLLDQISEGIADNLLIEMLYGGTMQERIKYATVLHLPVWFREGLVQYLARGWNTNDDNLLRDMFNNEQFKSYNKLSREKQILVGQNMWLFIDKTKDRDAIRRILYLVRLTRKVETTLYVVIEQGSKQLYSDWYFSHHALYAHELKRRIPLSPEENVVDPNHSFFIRAELSPDANLLATAYRKNGYLIIDVLDREMGKTTNLIKRFDYFEGAVYNRNELLLKWKDNHSLWVLENDLSPILKCYDINGEVLYTSIIDLDFVSGMDYLPSEQIFVFSGVLGNHTSIFQYNEETKKLYRLTESKYADSQPHFDQNGNLYFTRTLYKDSSRQLVSGWQKDIFYLFRNDTTVLGVTNVSKTGDVNEQNPIKLNVQYLSFLSDENGIMNAYAYKLDRKTFALSNYQTGILYQSINRDRTELLEAVLHNGYIFTYISPVDSSENFGAILYPSKTKTLLMESERVKNEIENEPVGRDSIRTQNEDKVYFQSPYPVPHNVDSLDRINPNQGDQLSYDFQPVHKGFMNIRPTRVITQINNSNFLTDEFGSRFSPLGQMNNRIGVALGIGLQDQFNNHIIQGRFRTLLNFSLFQYKVSYENRIGKIREEISFVAEHTRYNQNTDLGKRRMRAAEMRLTRPLSRRWSLSFVQRTRYDRFTPVFVDETSFLIKEIEQTVFDQGFHLRYSSIVSKADFVFKGLSTDIQSKYRLHSENGSSSIVSEARVNYGRKLRFGLFWINRVHMGNSTGGANNVFILGGNRNQYRPEILGNSIGISESNYLQPIYGVRNFDLNVRSGTTYGFVNTELYFPLNYLLAKRPIKSAFIQNLWLTAFVDAGTAWYGSSPNSRQNIANRTDIQDGRLQITVYNVKNPMVYSTGLGLRTVIHGYLIRYDLAWTYDNNVVRHSVGRLSIGRSF